MKYVSGRVKELKVGISSHSESKTSLTVIGNANVGGSLTAASFVGGGINTTGTSEFTNLDLSGYLNVAGVSTFVGAMTVANGSGVIEDSGGQLKIKAGTFYVRNNLDDKDIILGTGTGGVSLYNQGNKKLETQTYGVEITGTLDTDNLNVSGISTFKGDLDIESSVLITGITTIGGLVDINAGAQANTLKVEDLTDNRVVIAGTGGELEDDANLTFNGSTFNVGSGITMYQATGIISATKYHGDGSSLTGIDATSLKDENGNIKIQANSSGAVHSGVSTFNDIKLDDNKKVGIGSSQDLQLYHNATASYIDNNTGALYIRNNVDDDDGGNIIIQAKSGKTSAVFQDDEGVRLYYDDAEKVATTGYGVTVNGTTETQKLTVTGISTFSQTATFNGNVTLGNDPAADTISAVGRFGSDLVPVSTDDKDLGASNLRWRTLFVKSIVQGGGGISTFTNDIDVNGHTELNTLQVAGISTFNNDVTIGDVIGSKRLYIGNPNAQIYRQSNHLYIDVAGEKNFYVTTNSAGGSAGAIYLRPKGTEQGVTILPNGSVELYHDNSKKLDTIGTGVTVTGDLYATTFRGDGSGLTNLSIPGISTSTTSEFNNINVTGTTTLATAKVSDLTDNRIVIAGNAGELEDTSKLTFDGTTLAIVGNATFTGNVSVAGTLTSEDKTNIDSIGIVTARTGVRISSGGLVVASGVSTFTDAIDANGGITATTGTFEDLGGAGRMVFNTGSGTLDDHPNLSFTTGTETLNSSNLNITSSLVAASAKVSDLTSGRVVYVGTAGELQDSNNLTFDGTTLDGVFSGDGSSLTGITAGGVGAIGGLTVKDEGVVVGTAGSVSTFDFRGATVSVIANTGAAGIATVTLITEQQQDIQTLNVSGISTFNGNIDVISTDAGSSAAPEIKLYRNSATPANADYLGQIKFAGESSTGVERNYAKITGKILDSSNGVEDGILEFAHIKNGSQTITGRWRSDSLQLLNGTSLTVAGDVSATNFNSTSDARLKNNVQTITSPLEKLNQIDGVSFDWVEGVADETSSMGVIADTVEKVLPVLIAEHATGYKTVNYNGLIGLLIEAVKEQQVQITELKSKLDSLS